MFFTMVDKFTCEIRYLGVKARFMVSKVHRLSVIFQILFVVIFCSTGLSNEPVVEIPVTGKAVPQLKSIDNFMVWFVKKNQVPGGSVAITRNGKLVYTRGFGFADMEKQVPVESDNLFRIASLGKMITAIAVIRLAEDGKVKLTDRVCEKLSYIPYMKAGETLDPRLNQITVQDLLHHRGGWRANTEFSYGNIAKALGIEYAYPKDLVRYMMGRKLDFNPGSEMVYQNAGYEILGRMIEEISGDTYDNYIKKNILAPAGITDMQLARTEEKNLAGKEVKYYAFKHNPYAFNQFEGRYMWIATASDLAGLAAQFDDPSSSNILKQTSIERMFAPHPEEHSTCGKKYYGCGWEVLVDSKNNRRTWHTGGMPGTSAVLVRRADGINWVVLFNRKMSPEDEKLSKALIKPFDKVLDAVKVWPEF